MKKCVLISLLLSIILGLICFIFDSQISLFFKSISTALLDELFAVFRPFMFIILFSILIILFLIREHRRRWVFPLALTLVLSTIVSFSLKLLIMRARPFGLIETIFSTNFIDYSFPSSHAVAIFAVLPLLDKEFRKFKWFWFVIASLIALSRVYFGVHFASDVIFGAVIGYLIGYFCLKLEERYKFGEKITKMF